MRFRDTISTSKIRHLYIEDALVGIFIDKNDLGQGRQLHVIPPVLNYLHNFTMKVSKISSRHEKSFYLVPVDSDILS